MNLTNRVTTLFNIKYPIIAGGMVWVSGYKLASAVSNAGGLGLIGAGSMKKDLLKEHIEKCKNATSEPFGVNIPLLRDDSEDLIKTSLECGVTIFFTSAGNPAKHINLLKRHNAIVVHVVPSVKHAKKAASVGCDAIVGEGVEAGGHNGADEITTLSLIPQLRNNVNIPIIAAGGIAHGSQIAASLCLGAEGVQIGTLFAAALESSAHVNYKNAIIAANDTSTVLGLRKIGLTRMLKNEFSDSVAFFEKHGADQDELKALLSKKREMRGIFEGDLTEGELEAGQSSGLVNSILPVSDIFNKLINEYDMATELFR